MIPKILHYVWVGGAEIPVTQQAYIDGWRKMMPEWEIVRWDESNFSIADAPLYVRQAYEAKKYAFVSDYVRLWALEQYGGVYMDTDVEVVKPLDAFLNDTAFIGFEESLAHLPGTCVYGCEAHCQWVKDMLALYDGLEFVKEDGSYDLTTNVRRMGERMMAEGLVPNGKEQYIEKWGLRVYDHHHFSPITSTRVMRKSKDTYAIHHFAGSWQEKKGLLNKLKASPLACEIINAMVQVKRLIKGQK